MKKKTLNLTELKKVRGGLKPIGMPEDLMLKPIGFPEDVLLDPIVIPEQR